MILTNRKSAGTEHEPQESKWNHFFTLLQNNCVEAFVVQPVIAWPVAIGILLYLDGENIHTFITNHIKISNGFYSDLLVM